MKWNKKFNYPSSTRALINGRRHYSIDNSKLPSVTTILGQTQPEEKRKAIEAWQARLGARQADRQRDLAAMRGTSMHTYLEAYLRGSGHLDLTSVGKEAGLMAKKVIESGRGDLEEKREWIEDYFLQLGAYAMAHNHIYDTKINQGVILMCSKDGFFQKFVVDGKEFVQCQWEFLRRVDKYYSQLNK